MPKVSLFDQIAVRVTCINCGPAEVALGKLRGQKTHSCARCGFGIRLDEEPLRSHLAMLLAEADEIDTRRRRSGYTVSRPA